MNEFDIGLKKYRFTYPQLRKLRCYLLICLELVNVLTCSSSGKVKQSAVNTRSAVPLTLPLSIASVTTNYNVNLQIAVSDHCQDKMSLINKGQEVIIVYYVCF